MPTDHSVTDASSLPHLTIYTDGGCKPNPGPGGWGAVILPEDGEPIELHGSHPDTTNNRMELQAAEEALLHLDEPSRVDLYTDSTYVRNGITKWVHG
ncbi:MAG: ribonuclease H, partial [Halobacteriales archaeon]|nr:ribonuclease H [Halobacteriales archaeon]